MIEQYLSEFVYGGIDGIITTFSIIAGSTGGHLLKNVIVILGISNVLSDGYSMGISRYISSKTEIKQGLLRNKNAFISSLVTFFSFIIVGILPVVPFFMYDGNFAKQISLLIASIVFFTIGALKGKILKESLLYSGLEVLGIGLTAAFISYFVGEYVSNLVK
tara:strand:+ start:127 stop:612 length:486 start_codon:yes stop_codon:yes gene_type:complete